MPRKRYIKKRVARTRRYAKKRATKKRFPQPNSVTFRGGLPKKLFTSSTYYYYALVTIAGTSNAVLATQSSPFQCIAGVANSQPLYFDTYKTLYNRCRVHGFKTTCTSLNLPTPTNTRGTYFGMYNADTGSVPGTMDGAMQQPGARSLILPFDKTPRTLKMYNKCNYTLGTSKVMYNTDLIYQSLVSTVPTHMAFTNMWWYNYNGDTTYVQVAVKVVVYCEYFEPTLVVNT